MTALRILCLVLAFEAHRSFAGGPDKHFEIQIVDDVTGRGVPLVELETVGHARFMTDSAGRIAFLEPGLMDREAYFHVRSHGYAHPKDGFGFAGVKLVPKAGAKAVIRIKRLNVAERLYRITGEGIYRDSVLLGHKVPLKKPVLNAGVMGQDTVQAAVLNDKVHWIWGDTNLARYPLGNFRSSGAVSDLPGRGGLDPSLGIDLHYFTDAKGNSREMCPLERDKGVVWLHGLAAVPDAKARERLVAHYARMKSLGEKLEHGVVMWNEDKQIFERAAKLELDEKWRFLQGHPLRHDGYIYFGSAFPTVRVKARLDAVLDPAQYEAWTCLASAEKTPDPTRTKDGTLGYAWRRDVRPVTPADELRWLKEDKIKPEEASFTPADTETGKRINLHAGSVRWNAHRKRFILIGTESAGSSFLGEVWYSESDAPTGPWRHARKIVTHERYSFYNPAHHDFFDQSGGRLIYFEGTYTHTFSGNPVPTPRYDYNQIMYRLDLDDERLSPVRK